MTSPQPGHEAVCGEGTAGNSIEYPRYTITSGTSVWQDTRCARLWNVPIAMLCGMCSGLCVMLVVFVLEGRAFGLADFLLLPSWTATLLAAAGWSMGCVFFLGWAHRFFEHQLAQSKLSDRFLGLDDFRVRDASRVRQQQRIAERFFLVSGRVPLDPGLAVRRFDFLCAEAGVTEEAPSLLIEEGRPWSEKEQPTLRELVDRAFADVTLGEVEPVRLPLRLWTRVTPFYLGLGFLLVFLLTGNDVFRGEIVQNLLRAMAEGSVMLGVGGAFAGLIGYVGCREFGFFPLGAWQGECSIEKTSVFERFRRKDFYPGRDLAVVRFTGHREADVVLLGVNGDSAVVRVGGRYLDHFLACWAFGPRRSVPRTPKTAFPNSPSVVLPRRTALWSDKRLRCWKRPWPVAISMVCAVAITMCVVVFLQYLPIVPEIGIHDPLPALFRYTPIFAGLLTVTIFFVLRHPVVSMMEREQEKHRVPLGFSEDGNSRSFGVDAPSRKRRVIAEQVFFSEFAPGQDFSEIVCRYAMLHAEAGLAEDWASLIIEEGRHTWWDRRPKQLPILAEIVDTILAESTFMEDATWKKFLLRRAVRSRRAGALVLMGVGLVLLSRFPVEMMIWGAQGAALSMAPRVEILEYAAIGMSMAGVATLGFLGLGELGISFFGSGRRICTATETKIYHRGRWKTFRPGRDLAVVRFTGHREADVVLLGADGSYTTLRLEDESLGRFVICWAFGSDRAAALEAEVNPRTARRSGSRG